MQFRTHSHRFAEAIINSDQALLTRYKEFTDALYSITDLELVKDYISKKIQHRQRGTSFKSLTSTINSLIKSRINSIPGWNSEVEIFNDEIGILGNTEWRLDFACDNALCVEVAFNHGEAIAWNLLKPVLAFELNHVKKAVQGKLGIYVCATDDLKKSGNIDSSSGSFEKVLRYLTPMMNQLTVPIMIIGLEAPTNFFIDRNSKNVISKSFIPDITDISAKIQTNDGQELSGKIIEYSHAAYQGNPASIVFQYSGDNITIYENYVNNIEYEI